MIMCSECKAAISDQAATCPQCGAPRNKVSPKRKTSLFTWIMAVLSAGMLFSCLSGQRKAEQVSVKALTPEQAAAKAQSEADFQFGVLATKAIRANLKNPASFEFVDAGVVQKGALCLSYRATNSFGAMVTEQVAVTRDLKKGSWNKECGGRSVPNFSHIKHAL